MEQGSEDWFQARIGKVTASRIGDLMAKTKSGPAASRTNYMSQLICERLTGTKTETFTSSAMQWGTDTEPLARAAYESHKGLFVTEVGFIDHPTIPMSGASPDGLVGNDGLIEIKCPGTSKHIETLLNDHIDSDYKYQMQWQMMCTGRKWCDFVSYDPRMPDDLQLKIIHVPFDQKLADSIQSEVISFLADLDIKD